MQTNKKLISLSLLIAMGSILFTVESLIQFPFFWFRIGIANCMTILALKWWGLKEGLIVSVFRVILGSLLSGRFFSPLFVMAMSGGIASTLAMRLLMIVSKTFIGPIGVSIFGAVIKNMIQISISYLTYIRTIEIFYILPILILMSLFTGLCIGFLTILIDAKLYSSRILSEYL